MVGDLIDYVTASDSIKVSKVLFDYRFDPDAIAPGTFVAYDICPGKPKNKRVMDFDLSKFGFPGLDFHATVVGEPNGQGPAGEPLIAWDVDQQIGRDISQFGATLDRITGHFVTAVTPINPAVKRASCAGPDRYYGGILSTIGSENRLELTFHKEIAGISHRGTATLEPFVLDAVVGEPLSLGVSIAVPSDRCTKPIVEGSQAEAFAATSGVPLGVIESYAWRVEGGAPIGATDQWRVSFTTPTVDPVYVSVEVGAGDQSAFDTAVVFPVPVRVSVFDRIICRLRTIIQRNSFVDPLWDPIRDFSSRPLTTDETRRIGEAADQIASLADQLADELKTPRVRI